MTRHTPVSSSRRKATPFLLIALIAAILTAVSACSSKKKSIVSDFSASSEETVTLKSSRSDSIFADFCKVFALHADSIIISYSRPEPEPQPSGLAQRAELISNRATAFSQSHKPPDVGIHPDRISLYGLTIADSLSQVSGEVSDADLEISQVSAADSTSHTVSVEKALPRYSRLILLSLFLIAIIVSLAMLDRHLKNRQ